MNFIEELRWRGMLHDMTPGAEEYLSDKKITGYIGFDPTAPSMTIGNFVQLMILKLFQLSGHKPIVLMGGATGRIGDPSFKENERDLKSYEELDKNLSFQMEQVKKLLEFEGDNAALIVNNLDFYKNMNVLDFLRDVGKTLTVNYMMSKDSVKNRLETGLSFTEFSYQLLQAYDFQLLHEKYNCHLQMGGSDQWGNITSGTEFIRRNTEGKAYAVTTPLLTKADGSKFGKSEQGNIWLDPDMTSPYQFYQFWINSDDADISKYLRYFSLKPRTEVERLEALLADDPRAVKAVLAEELTTRVHSAEEAESARQVSMLLFGRDVDEHFVKNLSTVTLENIAGEIPAYTISKDYFDAPQVIIDLLSVYCPIFPSKTEARKAIQNNAVSVNKIKIIHHDHELKKEDLLHGKYLLVENGKKNKFVLKFDF
ncbi:MAG: tyrosine--tRNA ligase [Saprospiraceae bacterium]|nr:tyrosine--tRNA ligase [Saprospiraceae bacterium]